MEDTQRLLIEFACTRVLNQYAVATDSNDTNLWLDVFTDDAVWEATNLKLEGRQQLEKFFLNRTNGKTSLVKHLSANELITVIDDGHASAVSTMIVFRQTDYSGSGPGVLKNASAIIQNQDDFVRVGGHWKIKKRVTIPAFAAKDG